MNSTATINAHIARSRELEREFQDDPWSPNVRRGYEMAVKDLSPFREAPSVAVAALKEIHHPSEPKGRHERIAEEALKKISSILT